MKISLEWLSEFLEWKNSDPAYIAEQLSLCSAEVELIEQQGKYLDHCCVGKVATLKQHPNADRLRLAEVETDKGTKTVVCGGTNLREGMMVAFAHTGALVKGHDGSEHRLEPISIRGVESSGMICAAEELELTSLLPPKKEDGEKPIMDLGRLEASSYKLKAGAPLRTALEMTDTVLHISNTAITSRGDLFSHAGFARECIALGLAKAKWPKPAAIKYPKAALPFGWKTSAKESLTRYLGVAIDGTGLGETPVWMKKRLEAVGLRSINLPVDITNYVMMEWGAPTHCFDRDDVKGTAELRLTKAGERIRTLDGIDRPLPEGALVLSDDEGIFDLVAMMGGKRTSVSEKTKHFYVQIPVPDSTIIHKTIMATGHRTDAATIFEKGVPPVHATLGFVRAVELFQKYIPDCKIVSSLNEWGSDGKPKAITLTSEMVNSYLGMDIPVQEMTRILTDLGCTVKATKAASKLKAISYKLVVTPPLHRLADLIIPQDIIEEIGRIHGYADLPEIFPEAATQIPARDHRTVQLRTLLADSGYHELAPLAFVSEHMLSRCNLSAKDAVEMENPLGEETRYLQTSLAPQLLAHCERALKPGSKSLRTFCVSKVFSHKHGEHFELGILLAQRGKTDVRSEPLFALKNTLKHSFDRLFMEFDIHQNDTPPTYAHPGRSGSITVHGKHVGTVCEVHPRIAAACKVDARVCIATINLSTLLSIPAHVPHLKLGSAFPAISYDVTVNRAHTQPTKALIDQLQAASKLLSHVSVENVYDGNMKEKGHYALTLRFTYQSADRTLTEEEVKAEHEKVLKSAKLEPVG